MKCSKVSIGAAASNKLLDGLNSFSHLVQKAAQVRRLTTAFSSSEDDLIGCRLKTIVRIKSYAWV